MLYNVVWSVAEGNSYADPLGQTVDRARPLAVRDEGSAIVGKNTESCKEDLSTKQEDNVFDREESQ